MASGYLFLRANCLEVLVTSTLWRGDPESPYCLFVVQYAVREDLFHRGVVRVIVFTQRPHQPKAWITAYHRLVHCYRYSSAPSRLSIG